MSFNASSCLVKEKRQKIERSSMGLRSNTDEQNLTVWELSTGKTANSRRNNER